MDESAKKVEIVKAIASLAHSLNIEIVVEGIETGYSTSYSSRF